MFLKNTKTAWIKVELYFFTQNYEKSIEIIKKLKDMESMKNNPYLYYRLALCYIELELQKNEEKFKKNNENDLVNKTIYNADCEEPSFRKRFLLVNQSLTPSISESNSQSDDKKENNENNENENISVFKFDFNEAIRALKECILIIKGYNSFNEQIQDILKPLNNNDVINLKPFFEKNNENEEEKEKNITEGNNNQYKEIYENAYLNLIFCLIRSEYYAEALETIEEFKENNNEISQYKSILDNYAIEVYLRLGDFEKALNLAKENLSNENQDEKGSFLSNSNNQVYNEITYRLALYINLIKINILNNNFKEAQKYIVSVLSLLNYPTEKELPPYVINIIVFYFLSIGKNEEAVQIIKFRRIPKFYNN